MIKTLENNQPLEAILNIVENRGNVSKAMLDAGYSEAYASNPHQFVATKQFQELTEAYLPDDMLLRALQEDIESKVANRKAELELAFKIKGRMVDKIESKQIIQHGILQEEDKDKLIKLFNEET